MEADYDLVVIGCGPAGEKGAVQAAFFGKKVAVIEKAPWPGGACANTGTLASKTLRESALFLAGHRQRRVAGIEVQVKAEPSVADFMAHRDQVCDTERSRIRTNLERHGVELIRGSARLVDAHTVEVGERHLRARFILIATGSVPVQPPGIPFEAPHIDDSDTVLDLDRVPRSLVVVGAGVIGSEYASVFAALGTRVTLVDGRDRLLPFLDPEISQVLLDHFRTELGMEVLLGERLEEAVEHPEEVVVRLKGGRELRADRLLICAGRRAAVDGLGLDAAGVEVDERGNIKVDADYRTSAPSVLAAGDVIGFPALASTSMEQARIAVCRAFDLAPRRSLQDRLPVGIYTVPEASAVGDTLEGARARGIDALEGVARYVDNARGQIDGDPDGLLKLVFRADDHTLLGVHMVGEKATELVHIGAMAVQNGLPIDVFVEQVFNYPTLSELYKYAAYDGLGRLRQRSR